VSAFFPERSRRLGLALFLNAGDPPLDVLVDVVALLDAGGVECLELAVPFPDSPTDGPVIRRSAARALAAGVDLDATLAFVAAVRPRLRTLRIALLADWRHTVRRLPADEVVRRVQGVGADALLIHGVPPRARRPHQEAAAGAGLALVSTCFAGSDTDVFDEAARHGSAYVYLVAHHGRTGTAPPPDGNRLAPAVQALRRRTDAPIAIGFGVKTRADLEGLRAAGADAAVVGSACVACVEGELARGGDVVDALDRFLTALGRPG
jgi:tryptophan synthase alpha chain